MANDKPLTSLNADEESPSNSPIVPIVVGIIVLIVLAGGIALLVSSGDDTEVTAVDSDTGETVTIDEPIELGEVLVLGDALPRFENPAADPAVGTPAPELQGLSYTGEQTDIVFDGRPKLIAFLAHWCPHCQAEVPELVDWLEAGGLPDGVDLYAVATATQEGQANYPPSEWFVREGLDVPAVMDDGNSSAAEAMGLPGFPYWVVVDSAGLVVMRASGQLPDVLGLPSDQAFDFIAQRALNGAG